MEVVLAPPHLIVRFGSTRRVASWAIVAGGMREANAVVWAEVRNADLTLDVDPAKLLEDRLCELGLPDAVGLLTSRNLSSFEDVTRRVHDVTARCIATVGLGNALRAGDPCRAGRLVGTINVLCIVEEQLSEEALLEVLALASEAKTLAIREEWIPSIASQEPASGTGTDCIVIACPTHGPMTRYAGKHTLLGHVVGDSVRQAVARGAARWKLEQTRDA